MGVEEGDRLGAPKLNPRSEPPSTDLRFEFLSIFLFFFFFSWNAFYNQKQSYLTKEAVQGSSSETL